MNEQHLLKTCLQRESPNKLDFIHQHRNFSTSAEVSTWSLYAALMRSQRSKQRCRQIVFKGSHHVSWCKHILFRRKGLGAAYNVTMPSPGMLVGLSTLPATYCSLLYSWSTLAIYTGTS